MRVISWVLTAQDLLDACAALTATGDDGLERVRRSATIIASLAATNLSTVPGESGDHGCSPGNGSDDGAESESLWWQGVRRQLRQFTGDASALIDTVVSDMRDRLGVIIDSYARDAAELDDARTVTQHG